MTDSSPTDPAPLTDAADALRRAGNRPAVASELFALLQTILAETVATLRDAHRAGNLPRLQETAHRLHGATQYCGVPRLRAEVAEVERLCGAGDPPALERAVGRLLETAEATRVAADPTAGCEPD